MPEDTLALSEPRRRLVSKIQDIRFGAIENLVIKDGDPVFGPDTCVVRDRKLGKSDPCAAFEIRESPLEKEQFTQLFSVFTHIRNGLVSLLEIQNGLPFKIRTKERLVD